MSTWWTTTDDDGIHFEKNECETEMTWNTHGAGRNGMKKAVNIAFIQVVTFTEPFSAHSARAPFLANEAICSLIKLS